PAAPAYHAKTDGAWHATSYAAYAAEVRTAARALVALGLGPKDTVCILGFNRPEWVVFDVAAMCVGAAPAGIYTTSSPAEVQYIVDHAESPVILLENAAQWAKVDKVRDQLPKLRHVVMMKGAVVNDPLVLSWEQFLAKAEGVPDAEIDRRVDALKLEDLATLIYTSGTTGPPKAVMLSHDNLAWTAGTAVSFAKFTASDSSLSYLPLSHIAEQMFSIHAPITAGSSVWFAESMEKVPENLKEVQPTVVFAVPRIWEKFHAGLSVRLGEATGVKAKLVAWATETGRAYNAAKHAGKDPGGWLGFQHQVAHKLIYSKVKPLIGLGRARICISGAAPVAKEVISFLSGLDIVVHEVYGQSEGSGPTTFNLPDGGTLLGSVGKPIPGCEVKLAEDGEICARGRNVFLGYYKDPAATAETLQDGWLLSGDLGAWDADGYLAIVGRKKEILITAGGKNIAPKNIEAALKNHPLIGEAVVIGDRRAYLTALLQIDPDALKRFGDANGIADVSADHAKVREELQKAVDACNEQFARVEHVRKWRVLPRPLAIDTGELTPTLKIKRKKVYENFSSEIEAMYTGAAD
ncbi:MAG: AMP-dependent synthetase/ligase, partial [Myxococcota bacterium]